MKYMWFSVKIVNPDGEALSLEVGVRKDQIQNAQINGMCFFLGLKEEDVVDGTEKQG
jgi:hypothetical protein